MAFLQVARGLALMLSVFYQGCHSQQPQCGVAANTNLFVSGQGALPNSWPWNVAVNISGSYACGGTLINNQWVLTAARCLSGNQAKDIRVLLGLHSMSNPGANVVTMTVQNAICHPDYKNSRSTFENDICLLKLSDPVTFSQSIQPICLSSGNSTFQTGVSSWITGFGFTGNYTPADILRQVTLPIMGSNQCDCFFRHLKITDNMICAGKEIGGLDSCLGDVGSPLMIQSSTSWVQVGVLTFDYNCSSLQNIRIFTRLPRYEDWIQNTVKGSDVGFVTITSPGVDPDSSFICPIAPPSPNNLLPPLSNNSILPPLNIPPLPPLNTLP